MKFYASFAFGIAMAARALVAAAASSHGTTTNDSLSRLLNKARPFGDRKQRATSVMPEEQRQQQQLETMDVSVVFHSCQVLSLEDARWFEGLAFAQQEEQKKQEEQLAQDDEDEDCEVVIDLCNSRCVGTRDAETCAKQCYDIDEGKPQCYMEFIGECRMIVNSCQCHYEDCDVEPCLSQAGVSICLDYMHMRNEDELQRECLSILDTCDCASGEGSCDLRCYDDSGMPECVRFVANLNPNDDDDEYAQQENLEEIDCEMILESCFCTGASDDVACKNECYRQYRFFECLAGEEPLPADGIPLAQARSKQQARSKPVLANNNPIVPTNRRFVVFSLCTSFGITGTHSCDGAKCDGGYGLGEYMIPLEDYLEFMMDHVFAQRDSMCKECEERCNTKEDNCDCYSECDKIETEENGFIDATIFSHCSMLLDGSEISGVWDNGNKKWEFVDAMSDEGHAQRWAGPTCSSDGSKITISVFKDKFCNVPDSSTEVEQYLMNGDGYPMKLSDALLKQTYSTENCASCLIPEVGGDDSYRSITCDWLYSKSTKCENPGAFPDQRLFCDFLPYVKEGFPFVKEGQSQVEGGLAGTGTSICTEDTLECKDGTVLVRDADNNCEFLECPIDATSPVEVSSSAIGDRNPFVGFVCNVLGVLCLLWVF